MKPSATATALPFLKGMIILLTSAMIATGCVMFPLAIANDSLTLVSAAVFGALIYVGLYLFDRPVRPLAVLLALLLLGATDSYAQTSAVVNSTNISAPFSAGGDLFNVQPNYQNSVAAPVQNPMPLYTVGQLWIGGIDQSGILHVAAQTYRQTGTDYWPGPLDTSSATSTAIQAAQWNRVWAIRQTMIDSFRAGFYAQTPPEITDWPANGNPAAGEAQNLAPYADLNANNTYEPSLGEYPVIRGDEAAFFIFHDHQQATPHGLTGGLPMGVEVQVMAYGYHCADSAIANSIFVHYTFINRSSNTYTNCYAGHWLDIDLGNFTGDAIGADSTTNLCYMYEAGLDAVGFVLLNRSLSHTLGVDGSPGMMQTGHYYNYLQGRYRDSSSVTYGGTGYGGTTPVNIAFTGDPVTGVGWLDPITTADKRLLGSSGPFTLVAGQRYEQDIAFIHARDYANQSPYQAVQILKQRAGQLQQYYDSDSLLCGSGLTAVSFIEEENIQIFPNPASTSLTINCASPDGLPVLLTICDLTGRVVLCEQLAPHSSMYTVNVEHLAKGAYSVSVSSGQTILVNQLVMINR